MENNPSAVSILPTPGAPAAGAPRPSALEVRPVGKEAFEEIYPLLKRFPTQAMTRDEWRWALFDYPWSTSATRGFALYADGKAVGFLGTILSEREIAGRREKVCNPSSWIVLEEYRYAAMLLLRPLLQMLKDHVVVGLTPSPAAYALLAGIGLEPLDTRQYVLLPAPGPIQLARTLSGSVCLDPAVLRAELPEAERRFYDDHAASPVARHVLLRRGQRRCYLVATLGRKRGVPYADVQHVSDRAFFWEHRLLVHAALTRAMGLPGLAVAIDSRFLVGRAPWVALRWKARRLYHPTRPEITPELVDGLYTEQMGIRY
jgi:hypothetical protein